MKYFYQSIKYNKNLPGRLEILSLTKDEIRESLHLHKELEFIYIIDGTLYINTQDNTNVLNTDDLCFFNSEVVHSISCYDLNKVKYLSLHLSYEYLRSYFRQIDRVKFIIDNESKDKIKILLKKLILIKYSDDRFIDLSLNSVIFDIYHLLLKSCLAQKSNLINDDVKNLSYITQAIEYVDKNYKNKITLNDISKLLGVTPHYFSKYFKTMTKINFITYINNVRLEHALNDIINKDMKVIEASVENGFPSIKSFIEVCKKTYGLTPSEYKRKNGEDYY